MLFQNQAQELPSLYCHFVFILLENQFLEGQVDPNVVTFHLNKFDLNKMIEKTIFSSKVCLWILIYKVCLALVAVSTPVGFSVEFDGVTVK